MQYKYHRPTCGLEGISIALIIPIREVQHLLYNMFYQKNTDGFVDTSITPITPNTPAHLHIITGPSSSNIYRHTPFIVLNAKNNQTKCYVNAAVFYFPIGLYLLKY